MLNCNEIWKPVKGFEKLYEISNFGKVRNNRGLIMKTYIINSGYEAIKFTVKNKRFNFLIHRLVLENFKPTTNPLLIEGNHKDENKLNNFVDNLEWVTSKQNKQYSIKSGRYDKIKETKNSLGKKHLSNTYSKFHNVSFDRNRNKWVGSIRVNNKTIMMKRFDSEIEAALHVNFIIDTLNLTDRPKNIIT